MTAKDEVPWWHFFHTWSRWLPSDQSYNHDQRHCKVCGKRQDRWIG